MTKDGEPLATGRAVYLHPDHHRRSPNAGLTRSAVAAECRGSRLFAVSGAGQVGLLIYPSRFSRILIKKIKGKSLIAKTSTPRSSVHAKRAICHIG